MKIRYWGTGASNGIPGVFCGCKVCQNARRKGGKEVRSRAQILIDDALLVDFGPDTYMNALRFNFDLSRLTSLLVTHSHLDHYYMTELFNRKPPFCRDTAADALAVYGPPELERFFDADDALRHRPPSDIKGMHVIFNALKPFKQVRIGGYRVLPVPATHATESPFCYVVSDGKSTVFYMEDSGLLRPDVFNALASLNLKFDLVSYDCALGTSDAVALFGIGAGHMGLPNVLKTRADFINAGMLAPAAPGVLTHFSHDGGNIPYAEFAPIALREGFITAYDGLTVSI
ncbi:MAG: MBL fold metallo-hydrolase [Clostridiales bacterium]|jgi:phosphoribosyl 1,2-cyclic phosphate phosphodiesterase|nr:MBL fold metallo-hydrolase [Clostridiales bacterium]